MRAVNELCAAAGILLCYAVLLVLCYAVLLVLLGVLCCLGSRWICTTVKLTAEPALYRWRFFWANEQTQARISGDQRSRQEEELNLFRLTGACLFYPRWRRRSMVGNFFMSSDQFKNAVSKKT